MKGNKTWLYRWLSGHLVVCFAAMTVSFIAFGCITVDLVRLTAANTSLVFSYGVSALMDGGAQQFVELWLGAVLAMALYLLFKLCEHALVHALAGNNASTDRNTNKKS